MYVTRSSGDIRSENLVKSNPDLFGNLSTRCE